MSERILNAGNLAAIAARVNNKYGPEDPGKAAYRTLYLETVKRAQSLGLNMNQITAAEFAVALGEAAEKEYLALLHNHPFSGLDAKLAELQAKCIAAGDKQKANIFLAGRNNLRLAEIDFLSRIQTGTDPRSLSQFLNTELLAVEDFSLAEEYMQMIGVRAPQPLNDEVPKNDGLSPGYGLHVLYEDYRDENGQATLGWLPTGLQGVSTLFIHTNTSREEIPVERLSAFVAFDADAAVKLAQSEVRLPPISPIS